MLTTETISDNHIYHIQANPEKYLMFISHFITQ